MTDQKKQEKSPFLYVLTHENENEKPGFWNSVLDTVILASSPNALSQFILRSFFSKGGDDNKSYQAPKGADLHKTVDAVVRAGGVSFQTYQETLTGPFDFPPGDPLPGRWYRRHPLNDHKRGTFIPVETFDELLYAEREGQLIRLLTTLGAVEIRISKEAVTSQLKAAQTGIGVSGIGSVRVSGSEKQIQSTSDDRTFKFEGATWIAGQKIKTKDFSWLPYEPTWRAVVAAREIGGCLSASLKLSEQSSFSLSVKGGLRSTMPNDSGSMEAAVSADQNQNEDYLVEAKFSPLQHPKETNVGPRDS